MTMRGWFLGMPRCFLVNLKGAVPLDVGQNLVAARVEICVVHEILNARVLAGEPLHFLKGLAHVTGVEVAYLDQFGPFVFFGVG